MAIAEALKKLKDDEITLITSPAEELLKNDIKVIKKLSRNHKGVYVTINQPYVALKRILEKKKVNLDNIFFIDMISSTVSAEPERTKQCLFINSPTSLTELGIAIEQLINSIKENKKFIFFDNLSAFLIYNELNVLSEFSHFIINKMRVNEVAGVIMSVEEEMGKELLDTISSFCDNVIKF